MPNSSAQAGETATLAEATTECLYQRNLAAYEAERERVKCDQTTLDMQYKLSFADHEKRRAAYARNVTRAYDLLMSQYCGDVMKEGLETKPDYDSKISCNESDQLLPFAQWCTVLDLPFSACSKIETFF